MKARTLTLLVALFSIVLSAQARVNYDITSEGWCVRVQSYTNKLDAVKAIIAFKELEHTGTLTNTMLSEVPCLVLKGAERVDALQLVDLLTHAGAQAEALLPLNEKHFGTTDDTMFLNFLADNYDSDNDGFMTYSEVSSTMTINISENGMSRVPGLKWFFNLRMIDCTHCHNIYYLDVSQNQDLRIIKCSRNYMTNNAGSGNGAQKLIDYLPTLDDATGTIYFYDNSVGDEMNEMTEEQVVQAARKGWRVLRYNATTSQWEDYIQDGIAIDASNFPDPNFHNFVTRFDTDGNKWLSKTEIDVVTTMDAHNQRIADFTGIEHFTKLKELEVNGNKCQTLDLSQNTAIEVLDCSDNDKLTTLNLKANVALKTLNCGGCGLTKLDVTKNKNLESLFCHENNLNTLNVTQNTKLEMLECSFNQLSTLDISKNTQLVTLACHSNQLSKLDISKNTKLSSIAICFNQIKGRAMYELVTQLPEDGGELFVPVAKDINSDEQSLIEGNVLTKQLAMIAFKRGWSPGILDLTADDEASMVKPYNGSAPDRVMSYNLHDCVVSLSTATEDELQLYYGILNGLFLLGDLKAGDQIAPYYSKNNKLLFTLSNVNTSTIKVTVAPGVTTADNIHHVLTDDDRIELYLKGKFKVDYFDVKSINLNFGSGITTGIRNVEADAGSHTRYNLSGQRVGQDYRGIVIENGRKRVVK